MLINSVFMETNNSKKYGIVLLINIGVLVFFIFSCYLYNHRQVLMSSEKPITNYSVLEVYPNYRMRSSISVEYNGKQYYVGVKREQCKTLNVKLYYDRDRDEIFEQEGIPISGLVILFFICLGWLVWLLFIIWRRRKELKLRRLESTKAIEKACLTFAEAATEQAKAMENGDYKKAKKHYKIMANSVRVLRETYNIKNISNLLDSKSTGARLWAATFLLPVFENEAMQVLQQIANEKGILSSTAKTTIDKWKKGILAL